MSLCPTCGQERGESTIAQKPETCVWTADIGKLWKTGCGYLLQDSGNPEEGLCPICNKRVEVKK